MRWRWSAIVALGACMPVLAQTSSTITYQGRLAAQDGPVNGSADFNFTLWKASSAGVQVGTRQLDNVIVTNGLFTVPLDFGLEPSVYSQQLWIEVSVRSPSGAGDYTTLSPRQPLTRTPNAIYAEQAGYTDTAGYSASTRGIFVGSGVAPNVGIRTATPQYELEVAGTIGSRQAVFRSAELGPALSSASAVLHMYHGPAHGVTWPIRFENTGVAYYQGGMRIDNEGFLNITNVARASNPTSAVLNSNGQWGTLSDRRVKHDVEPLSGTLDRALRIRPVSFHYNGQDLRRTPDRQVGVIAQELNEVYPSLVTRPKDGMMSVNYAGLGVVAIGAVQELKAQKDAEIASLKAGYDARIAELESREAALRVRLERLEAALLSRAGLQQ